MRLLREIRAQGYTGGNPKPHTWVRSILPLPDVLFERRFETPPGKQAQANFSDFEVTFATQPNIAYTVWLFSLVLGRSRYLWTDSSCSESIGRPALSHGSL